ncbi:MAG: flagellar biosynthesis protein FlhB [Deltaproteobacteria bacterium]|jgi:flagellar biosynthesis protein FlhB
MADNDQEKTENATPKREREAREEGQAINSKEVSSAIVLLGAIVALYATGSWMVHRMAGAMQRYISGMGEISLRDDSLQTLILNVMAEFALIVSPVMLATLIFGIAASVFQVGFTISTKSMSPKLSKLNPIQGIGKLFSIRSFTDVIKAIGKILVLGSIAYSLIKGEAQTLPLLIQMDVQEIWAFIGTISLRICLYTFLAMAAIAGMDYLFQWWQHQKDLRMTKEEVKEESRQTEGDPKVKSRIRSIQLEMSRRRMMDGVPDATVVITNPTHLAIALKYDSKNMQAPKVVAKGAGFIAERIKEIARSNRIPIVENKPLARAMFKSVVVGADIPFEMYRTVAEILAYVYRLKGVR